jgi:hypothetical protein
MNSTDDDKKKASEDDLRKAVEDLKKKPDTAADRGDMPVDSSLGHPDTKTEAPGERLPPDDDEN